MPNLNSNSLSTLLNYLAQGNYITSEQAADPSLAHERLHSLSEKQVNEALQGARKLSGIDSEAIIAFQDWVKSNNPDVSGLQRNAARFGAAPGAPEVVVSNAQWSAELKPFADVISANPDFQVFARASKNAVEQDLYLVQFLVQNEDRLESLGLKNPQAGSALVWEALARVDQALGSRPVAAVTSNTALRAIYNSEASEFLARHGLAPMSHDAYLMNTGRAAVGALNEGQGANYIQLLNDLLQLVPDPDNHGRQVPKYPEVYQLYQILKDVLKDHPVNPIDVDEMRSLNTEDEKNWFTVNGVARSLPLIDLYQQLNARRLENYGWNPAKFSVVSGESQGELRAYGFAGSFEREGYVQPLVPVGPGGYRSVQALKDELDAAAAEGYYFQEFSGEFEGMEPVLSVSKIPYEPDNESLPLNRLIAAVNDKIASKNGRPFPYVRCTLVNIGAPHYFNILSGTTAGIQEIRRLIETRDARGYSAAIQDLVRDLPTDVRLFTNRDLSITSNSHHAEILKPAYDKYLAYLRSRGISLKEPGIPLISNPTGEDVRKPGVDYTEDQAAQNYLQPVHLPKIVAAVGERAPDLIVDFGPGGVIVNNFMPKMQPGYAGAAAPVDSEKGLASLTSRSAGKSALGNNLTRPEASGSKAFAAFEKIEGVKVVEQQDLGDGRARVVIELNGQTYVDKSRSAFRQALSQHTQGPVHQLLTVENLVRNGQTVTNTIRSFTQPMEGALRYEWIVSPEGFETFKIYEDNQLAIEITAPDAEGRVTLHEYSYVNGKADLVRHYKVEGEKIEELTDGFVERARQAYLQDWNLKVEGDFDRDFETLPADLLHRLEGSYDITLTEADLIEDAKNAGSSNPKFRDPFVQGGLQGHPNAMRNRIGRDGMMKILMAKAFGLNLPNLINLGGEEMRDPTTFDAPIKPGNYSVRYYPTSIADAHITDSAGNGLKGRQVTGRIVITNKETGQVSEFRPRMMSLEENDLAVGEIRHLVPPRPEWNQDLDVFSAYGIQLAPLQNHPVVANGTITVPRNAARNFKSDLNRIHVKRTSGMLKGAKGAIGQGEGSLSFVQDAVISAVTQGRPELFVGVKNLPGDIQYKGYVYPGDTLTYKVTRERWGEGLHEYKVEVFRTDSTGKTGAVVLNYQLYAWTPEIVYVFPGQGDSYEGMAKDINKDPKRAEHLKSLQGIVDQTSHPLNLTEALDSGSNRTDITQPAYAAYNTVYTQWLRDNGYLHRHGIFLGHSIGEYDALEAAGSLDSSKKLGAVTERGSAMQGFVNDENPQGMRAITLRIADHTPQQLEEFRKNLEDACVQVDRPNDNPPSTVEIANYNHPGQLVVSGHESALKRLEELMRENVDQKWGKVKVVHVPVTTAFHARPMQDAVGNMAEYFERAAPVFGPLRRPVMSSRTGEYFPNDPAAIQAGMAGQLAEPVRFIDAVNRLIDEGHRTFRVMGPSADEEGGSAPTKFIPNIVVARGMKKDDVDVLYMNPDRGQKHWARASYEEAPKQATPAKAVTPAAATQVAASAVPTAPVAAVHAPAQAAAVPVNAELAAIEPKGPVWKTVSAHDLRNADTAMIQLAVDPEKPQQAGAQELLAHLTAKQAQVDLTAKDGPYIELAQSIAANQYVSLEPNAIPHLESHIQFLRGLLGLDGASLVPAPALSRAEIVTGLLEVFKRVFPTLVSDAKIAEKTAEKPAEKLHFQDDFGIDSSDMAGAWQQYVLAFAFALEKTDNIGKKKTVGDLADLIEGRLKAPKVIPDGADSLALRHFFGLQLKAKELAVEQLKTKKAKDEQAAAARAQRARSAGPVSPVAEFKMPVWREVSAQDFRNAQLGMLDAKVDPANPANSGEQALFDHLVANQAKVDATSDQGEYADLSGRIADQNYVSLQPNAIPHLEAHIQYLRGLLGLDGASLVPAPALSRAEIVTGLLEVFKRVFPTLVSDAKIAEKTAEKPAEKLHFQDDFGIDSSDMAGAWQQYVLAFAFALEKTDNIGKKKTVGDLADLIEGRLKAPKVIPDGADSLALRHFFGLQLKAEQKAVAKLNEQVAKANRDREEFERRSGQPMEYIEGAAAAAGMTEEDRAAFKKEIEAGVEARMADQNLAFAKALGIPDGRLVPLEVDLTTGKVAPQGTREKRALERKVTELVDNIGPGFADDVRPTYDPTKTYSFGRTEWNGASQSLANFISQLRDGTLTSEPEALRSKINRLANQLDKGRLARLVNHHRIVLAREFGESDSRIAVLDQLIARTRESLAEAEAGRGGKFDGVISLDSLIHVPELGEDRTVVVSRGQSTSQILKSYEKLGFNPEMIAAIRDLVENGHSLYGQEVLITGKGTIGAPVIAMLLELGAKVIYLDRGPRNTKFFRNLRDEHGVRGIDNQLIVEPNVHLSSWQDMEAVNAKLLKEGRRPRVILNMAAVSDYAGPTAQGEPFRLQATYVIATKRLAAFWGKVRVSEGLEGPVVICDHPTPNHNDIKGTGHYWLVKSALEDGRVSKMLFSEGIRFKDKTPGVVDFSILTPWSNPEDGIDVKRALESKSTKLMELLAFYSQAVEQIAREEYGVEIWTTSGSEVAVMTIAGLAQALKPGSTPIHKHYDDTDLGFKKLKEAAEARGETLDDVIQKVKERVDALNEAAKLKPRSAKRTDPTRLPNDGHPIDLNAVARRTIIDPRGAQGRFDAGEPFAVHPTTGSILGAGVIATYGTTSASNFRGLLANSAPDADYITPELEWLFHRDNYDLAHALKIDVKGLSVEEIEGNKKLIAKIDNNVGFRRPSESIKMETYVQVASPIAIEMPIPRGQEANFARWGWTIKGTSDGKQVVASIGKGQPIYVPAAVQWPVSVWNDIPGGLKGFNWAGLGITSSKDIAELAPGTFMGRIATAGALNAMGVSAAELNEMFGDEAIFTSFALALADLHTFNGITVNPLFQKPIGASFMNKLLGDAASGVIGTEQLGIKGPAIANQAACATGLYNVILAIRQLYAAMWKQEMMGQTAQDALGFAGGGDYAAFYSSIFGFYAVGALHTDQYAEEKGFADSERSRPGDAQAGGFVPGANAGVVPVAKYLDSLDKGLVPWSAVIGEGIKNDGPAAKAREMYGDGVEAALREALQGAKRVLPKDPNGIIILVDAHQTSTGGDSYELDAIARTVREELNLPEGYPVYVIAYKAQIGHGLGGATGTALALDQEALHRRVIPGAMNIDNILPAVGADSNIVYLNQALDLNKLYSKDTPIVFIATGFGFNGKNGVSVFVIPPEVFTEREKALDSLSKQVRRQIQARADARAIAERKRPAVQYIGDSQNYNVQEYADLWSVYSRSRAVAELLLDRVANGSLTLNFDDPLTWTPMLARDANVLDRLSDADRKQDSTIARIRAIEAKAQAANAPAANVGTDAAVEVDVLDIAGVERAVNLIHSGQGRLKTFTVNYTDPQRLNSRQHIVDALKAYAASKGVEFNVVHRTLEQKAMDAANVRLQELIASIYAEGDVETIREQNKTERQDEHVVWKTGGTDGMSWRRIVAEIEAGALKYVVLQHFDPISEERQYNAKALKAYAESKGVVMEVFHESAIVINQKKHRSAFEIPAGEEPTAEDLKIRETFDKIGAALDRLAELAPNPDLILDNGVAFGTPAREPGRQPIFVPNSNALGQLYMAKVNVARDQDTADAKTLDTMGRNPGGLIRWAAGRSGKAKLGATSKTYHYDWRNGKYQRGERGLGGVYYDGGLLGPSKDIARTETEEIRVNLPGTGDHKVLAYPSFMSLALGAIPGGWLFGLVVLQVLREKGMEMSMAKLATQSILRAWNTPAAEMMVDIDSHEKAILDEAIERFEVLKARINDYMAQTAPVLIDDPEISDIRYIPYEASRQIRAGIISDETMKVLSAYLRPDEVKALELASGPSPIHGGARSINAGFTHPVFEAEAVKMGTAVTYTLPVSFNGYSGITHGGMLDGIFEAFLRAWGDGEGKPLLAGLSITPDSVVRHITYKANALSGSTVRLELKPDRDFGGISVSMRDEANNVIAQAAYKVFKRLADEKGEAKIQFAHPKSGAEETASIKRRADIRPGLLQSDQEFGCLPGCVAAGHSHDTGLQFKYAFDQNQNVLWGVIDTLPNQEPLYSVMLAADDMAAWSGMRAAQMWGYTTTNTYIPVTPIQPGERVFLVAQTPKNTGMGFFDVEIQVMDAFGVVKGLLKAGYASDEDASINGIKGALAAQAAGSAGIENAIEFLKDSLGDNFKALVQKVKAQAQSGAPVVAAVSGTSGQATSGATDVTVGTASAEGQVVGSPASTDGKTNMSAEASVLSIAEYFDKKKAAPSKALEAGLKQAVGWTVINELRASNVARGSAAKEGVVQHDRPRAFAFHQQRASQHHSFGRSAKARKVAATRIAQQARARRTQLNTMSAASRMMAMRGAHVAMRSVLRVGR